MDCKSYRDEFVKVLKEDPEISPAVAALNILLDFVKKDTSETVQGLEKNIKLVESALMGTEFSVTSVKSACELFKRFISLTALDHRDFNECKNVLSSRGALFIENVKTSTKKIAKIGSSFILDDMCVLIHSHSRVVFHTLLRVYQKSKRRFHVFVTESAPDYSGKKMHSKLTNAGIPTTLILDSAIGYILERVDMVFLGAEGVVENGGIINKIGSYPIAICAKEMNKPVYVLAESVKFVRLCPLNQRGLLDESKYPISRQNPKGDFSKEHPMVDYTPPSLITLLFTDLGILKPSAVSDVLMELYL